MNTQLRSLLLRSAGAVALLAAGTAAASAQTEILGGGSTLATPTYELAFSAAALTPSFVFNYTSSGSGAAQTAFLTNTLSAFGTAAPTSGTSPDFPNVDFAASDAALTTAQLASFTGTGAVIQLPTMGTPITLPFNLSGFTTDGAINLTNGDVCGIFSGKITNWSGVATPVTSGAIKVAYRTDGSGTSFLLTQHLGATCTSSNSNFFNTGFPNAGATSFAGTTTFASLFPSSTVPANFVGGSGSPGVQAAVLATASSVGYLSPDFTDIALNNFGAAGFSPVAKVNSVLPSVTATTTALSLAKIPGEPSNTTTVPTVTTDPTHWVPVSANPASGYPIVGYTTWELAACYANADVGAGLLAFLDDFYNVTNSGQGPNVAKEINNGGFVGVPGSSKSAPVTLSSPTLAAAIVKTFLTSSSMLAFNTTADCTGR